MLLYHYKYFIAELMLHTSKLTNSLLNNRNLHAQLCMSSAIIYS